MMETCGILGCTEYWHGHVVLVTGYEPCVIANGQGDPIITERPTTLPVHVCPKHKEALS